MAEQWAEIHAMGQILGESPNAGPSFVLLALALGGGNMDSAAEYRISSAKNLHSPAFTA